MNNRDVIFLLANIRSNNLLALRLSRKEDIMKRLTK